MVNKKVEKHHHRKLSFSNIVELKHTSQKLSLTTTTTISPPHFSLTTKNFFLSSIFTKIQTQVLPMADENDISPNKPKPQLPAAAEAPNQPPSKFYSHFLYRAAFFTVFLVLIPLFPTEIINQSENARSWELLQLIFVGIAVSYGLFSKRNDDDVEKDTTNHQGVSKVDNAQAYVSKLLQVSSVFDDESENHTVIHENNNNNNKVQSQTWNSQYYRGEPVVVVAKENPSVKESNGVTMGVSQKPLLLPVRSLKQRVPEPKEVDLVNDDSGGRSTFARSSSSKRFGDNLSISKNGDFGGRSSEKLEEKTEDNIVLRSPIPWRSRSGRMEVEGNGDSPEFRLETRSGNPRLGKMEMEGNGDSPEFSSETRFVKSKSGMEVEDNGDSPEIRSGVRPLRTKSGRLEVEENGDSPEFRSGARPLRTRSGRMEVEDNGDSPECRSGARPLRARSGRIEVEDNGDSPEIRSGARPLRVRSGRMEVDENGDSPEMRSGARSLRPRSGRMEVDENGDSPEMRSGARSLRTRSGRMEVDENGDNPEFRSETRSLRHRPGRMEVEGSGDGAEFRLETRYLKPNPSSKSLSPSQSLSSPKAKTSEDAARKKRYTTPPPPPPPPPPFPRRDMRKSISSMANSAVSSQKEFKRSAKSVPMDELSDSEIDEIERKMYPGSDSRGKVLLHGGLPKSVRTFRSDEHVVEQRRKSADYDIKFSKEERNKLFEKVLVETSDDDDSEIDNELDKLVRSPGKGAEAANGDEPGPDVDKKADEFIAKFREQIRLQRINSFRRSAADRALKT